MGGAETAGIVIITVAIIQGLISLIKHLINRGSKDSAEAKLGKIYHKLDAAGDKLDSIQSKCDAIHEMHDRYDSDGTPMWYVPRSWADTQKEIVDRLHVISEVNMKMLGIIERLERRLEQQT